MSRFGRQGGFAAVAAIFIVVVLAALGAFMLVFSNTQQLTAAQDIQGSRAYWAARAGIEAGAAGAFASAGGNCPGTPTTMDGFTLVVVCTPQSFTDAGATVTIVSVTSIASAGSAGSIGYIERSITATLEK